MDVNERTMYSTSIFILKEIANPSTARRLNMKHFQKKFHLVKENTTTNLKVDMAAIAQQNEKNNSKKSIHVAILGTPVLSATKLQLSRFLCKNF